MRDLNALVKDVPIFCFQNGVRNEEIVSKYFPRVYGVMMKVGAVFTQDGEVTSLGDPPGRFVIGCYPEGTDELVESVAAKLRNAGYEVAVTPEIMPYKWGKLVLNLTNAVGAITNSSGEEVQSNCPSSAERRERDSCPGWSALDTDRGNATTTAQRVLTDQIMAHLAHHWARHGKA